MNYSLAHPPTEQWVHRATTFWQVYIVPRRLSAPKESIRRKHHHASHYGKEFRSPNETSNTTAIAKRRSGMSVQTAKI